MVGGRDYTVRRGLNRATQMRRQPGSALKPLAVYGPALELGYTTASVLLDEKTSFGNYTPRNAGDRYYGLVTMRTAVRNSLNTTAVRLLEEIGVNASIQYLNKMGIPTEKSDRNLSLALGSMTYGVTPVELAAAYAPYANGGVYHQPYCVSRIESADGNIVYERKESRRTGDFRAKCVFNDLSFAIGCFKRNGDANAGCKHADCRKNRDGVHDRWQSRYLDGRRIRRKSLFRYGWALTKPTPSIKSQTASPAAAIQPRSLRRFSKRRMRVAISRISSSRTA